MHMQIIDTREMQTQGDIVLKYDIRN